MKTESVAEARSPGNRWLPICNRLRTHPGWTSPEIYFRIVHVARENGPVVAYHEQTVEIALGITR